MDLISSPFDVEIHPSVRITVAEDGNLALCSDNIIGALSFNVSPFVHFCLCVTCQATSFHSQGHQKPWGHILSAPVPKGDKEYLSPCIHIQSSRGRPQWVHLGSHTYPQSQHMPIREWGLWFSRPILLPIPRAARGRVTVIGSLTRPQKTERHSSLKEGKLCPEAGEERILATFLLKIYTSRLNSPKPQD